MQQHYVLIYDENLRICEQSQIWGGPEEETKHLLKLCKKPPHATLPKAWKI